MRALDLKSFVAWLKPRLPRRGPWLLDLVLLVGLVLWAWRFFAPLEQVVNIELFDETGDIWAALRYPVWAYPPEYGPLYRLWYRLLALVQPDPLRLYYLSYRWAAILAPLAVYWSLRRARVTPGTAFWAAALLLVSQGHSRLWPRVSVFWLVVYFAALGVVWPHQARGPWWRVLLRYAWALWVAAYVRPETALVAMALAGLALLLWTWRWQFAAWGREQWALLGSGLFLLLLWGNPYQPDRLLLAFKQHFVVVRAALGDPIDNPWFATDKIGEYFTRTDSLPAMFLERPALLGQHIGYNAARLNEILFTKVQVVSLPGHPVLATNHIGARQELALLLMLGALPGVYDWLRAFGSGQWRSKLALWFRLTLPAWATLLSIAAGILLIMPHGHYLYLLWGAFLALYGLTFGRCVHVPETGRASLVFTLALVGVAAFLWRGHNVQTWVPRLQDPNRTVEQVARFVRALNLPAQEPIYVLGVEGQWEVYFGPQFVSLDKTYRRQPTDLATLIRQKPVGLILLTAPTPDQLFCQTSPQARQVCQDLLQRPEAWGFRAFSLPAQPDAPSALRVLVRANLLQPGSFVSP